MYKVEIINEGDSVCKVKSKDYEFVIDTKGKGIRPPDTLLASLGSCIGVYIRKYFEGAKIENKGFRISVNAEFTKELPICFREIKVEIEIEGLVLEEQRKKALLNFIKNCPVHNTLAINPHISISLK